MSDEPDRQSSDSASRKAKEAFVQGVMARGEAAEADDSGALPPSVTHEIVGADGRGQPIIKRRRFSMR